MSATVAIWIASVVGAGVFLGAGLLLGRRRGGARSSQPTEQAVSPREAGLHRQVMRLETRLSEMTDQRDRAQQQAASASEAQYEPSAGQQMGNLLRQLDQEVERRRAAVAHTDSLMRDLEAAHAQLARNDGEEVGRLASEQASLERRRTELERVRAALDRSRAEARQLREELDQLQQQSRAVEAANVTLQMQLGNSGDGRDTQPDAAPPRAGADAMETKPTTRMPQLAATDLKGLVEQLAVDQTVRGAVLADSVGLAIVGAGEEQDELAAAAALLADVGCRAARLLPVHSVSQISLADEEVLVATAHPLETPSGRLVLATLAHSPGPGPDVIQRVAARLAELV